MNDSLITQAGRGCKGRSRGAGTVSKLYQSPTLANPVRDRNGCGLEFERIPPDNAPPLKRQGP